MNYRMWWTTLWKVVSRRLEPDGLAIPLSWQIGTSRAPYSNRWIQKIKLERQNYTLIIDRQRTQLLLVTFLFIFAVGGLCVFFYIRNRHLRLAEAEDRIETLTRLLEDANKASESEHDSAFFKKDTVEATGYYPFGGDCSPLRRIRTCCAAYRGLPTKKSLSRLFWCGPIFIRLSILFITDFIPGWRRFTDTCFPRKKSRYAVCCAPTSRQKKSGW